MPLGLLPVALTCLQAIILSSLVAKSGKVGNYAHEAMEKGHF